MTDWTTYKFHASSLGKIMTGSKDKDDPLGETCKGHLLECWIKETYGREKDIANKYVEKGLAVEEDSITLYSRVKKKFFLKNDQQLNNDFLVGTPDLIDGDTVIDIKSSWDIFTFHDCIRKPINKMYGWQLAAYVALMKKNSARLVYCLVNTPENLIIDAKRRLAWDMGVIDPDANELYQQGCAQIEREMIFDDIPIEKRYIEFTVDLDKYKVDEAYKKIKLCREFLSELSK